MRYIDYLKDKWKTILLIIFAIVQLEIFLLMYNIDIKIKIYIAISILVSYFLGTYLEFWKKKDFYLDAIGKLEKLEDKYLIVEMLKKPDNIEEKMLARMMQESNKSMIENINKYKHVQEEYKEYIELWIHEIKLPIATARMIVENNKNEVTSSIDEEINEIEGYIEQALYYARSEIANKDYYIKKYNLKDIINKTIKQDKKSLINNKIKIEVSDLEKIVYTDVKWIEFILNQIIQNSIKYKNENDPKIIFKAKEEKENITLSIIDNGIGIKETEVSKVFDKGFTGTNGRIGKKSTGIGLYLCKKLCTKLGMGIEITSIEGEGTTVNLVFPKNSFIAL